MFSESFRIFSLLAINVCFLPHQDIHVSTRIQWHFGQYFTRKNQNQNIVIPIQSKFKHSDGQCLKSKTPILLPVSPRINFLSGLMSCVQHFLALLVPCAGQWTPFAPHCVSLLTPCTGNIVCNIPLLVSLPTNQRRAKCPF